MQYTNIGLVKHAEKALALKTKYMWGGILRSIEQQYDMLFRMYGNKAGTGYSTARWNELSQLRNKGYYGCDCIGLVKSYYWSGKADGGTGSPKYGAASFPDVNANYMYQAAKIKGKISTMPEIPGLIVYSKSHPHVGIYIGNGYTIESTLGARGDGVVKRKLDSFWEYWFECPYITYTSAQKQTGQVITAELAYNAVIRSEPSGRSAQKGKLYTGASVRYIRGSETPDKAIPKNIYVRLEGSEDRWIVKSAIRM